MTGFDDAPTLAGRFRQHAAVCSSPLYAELMRRMADDWDDGGPVRAVCAGWQDAPPGSVVQLRLLAALHALVLRGDAPELAPFYRTAGGAEPPARAWEVARLVIERYAEALRDGLAVAPQTNEVGRSAALAVGLADVVARAGVRGVRLLEVGASAGLNLLVDHYAVGLDDGRALGDAASPVQLLAAVRGPVEPVPYVLVERRGCDLHPIDARTAAGRAHLSSFVWPDHLERFRRLQSALDVLDAVAAEVSVEVDAAPAGRWLEQVLAGPVPDDVLTVVWQSITRMYWPADELARVDAALEEAGRRLPHLGHVAMEYGENDVVGAGLTARVWRSGQPDGARELLADVADHGVPVRLRRGVTVGP